MLNEFLNELEGYNAICRFLMEGLEYELNKNSPLRKFAERDIKKDMLRSGDFPIYDNPNHDFYYIDEDSKKCCKWVEDGKNRVLIPIFEIEANFKWNTNIDVVFTNLYQSLLEQEMTIMTELCSMLDDVKNYQIIMPVKQQLMTVLCNTARLENYSLWEHIGLGAIKK